MANLHLMSDAELPAVLKHLAASGSTARTAESWAQDRMMALVLGDAATPTAIMPMSRRTLAVSPGRAVNVGWLSSNQFASRMSPRRQTRGTVGEWSALLPELDALVVLRRDEASLAGRWYAQTGFHDVLSIRCLYLDMDVSAGASGSGVRGGASTSRYQVHVATPAQADSWDPARWQSQMLSVYRDVYAATGGTPVRGENFWSPALAHHYYRAHYQFQIIGLWTAAPSAPEATLMGYAVVGWSGWHSKRPRMDILELSTRQWDTGVASDLLNTTCQLALSKNVRQVRAVISAHDPYRGHLTRSGFVDRWGYLLLSKWLHAQRYLDRLAASLPVELGELSIQLAAQGELPLTLRRPSSSSTGTAPLSLQCDARTLTRLLLNRVDVSAALNDGTLFASPRLTDTDAARLSLAFPWTPWAFHMLDYI